MLYKMKYILIFITLVILIACGGGEENFEELVIIKSTAIPIPATATPMPTATSGTPTPMPTVTSATPTPMPTAIPATATPKPTATPQVSSTTKSQSSVESKWGKIIADDPQVFSTSDVSQETIDLTTKWYKIASDAWGNYGPLELYIVGNDMDAAKQMEEEFCDRHKALDPKWKVEWDCANEYYKIFTRYVTDGNAGVSTYRRDYIDYHFMTLIMSAKYPGPEEEDYKPVTLHEYFHIYQHAHISDLEINGDRSGRTNKMGGASKPWFAEGSAEFMAQLLYSQQPGVRANYLKDKMEYKYESVNDYLSYGKRLEDLSYNDPVRTYDIGTWFIAFLVNKFGEETLRVDYYKDLDSLGFEGSFKKHFKNSSKELVDEFDIFIASGKDKALEIIP